MKFVIFFSLLIISHVFGFSNEVQQEPGKEPAVKFYTQSAEYKKGQKVCFVFENTSGKEVYLPSSAPWAVFSEEKPETAIYSPVSAQVITVLKNGEKKEWCWNQQDIEGKEVPPGSYFVRITFFDDRGKNYTKKASFRIKL